MVPNRSAHHILGRFERTMQAKVRAGESQSVSKLRKDMKLQICEQAYSLKMYMTTKCVKHNSIQVSKFPKDTLNAFDDFKNKQRCV